VVALARNDEVGRAPLAARVHAADDRRGHSPGLAEHELGGTGDLVGHRDLGGAKLAPTGVRRAAQVPERSEARDAERDVGRPLPPRAAERVAHDHADVRVRQVAQPGAKPSRRPVGIERQQHEDAVRRRVGGVDPCRRADEAVPRLCDHERWPGAHHLAALAQDHLHVPRITVRPGQLHGACGRLDVREPHHAALDLGDRLLRDDDDVTVLEASDPPCRGVQEEREIVALLQLREPLERDHPDDAGGWVCLGHDSRAATGRR
jgi:hypothetical protein